MIECKVTDDVAARELSNTISTGSYDWITRCWASVRLHLATVSSACYSIFLGTMTCQEPNLIFDAVAVLNLSLSPFYILLLQYNINYILKHKNKKFRQLTNWRQTELLIMMKLISEITSRVLFLKAISWKKQYLYINLLLKAILVLNWTIY